MKFVLDIAYKGSNYHGWQRQPNAISVQEVVSAKLSVILGEEIEIVASGRTDAGVHALQQIVHFVYASDLPKGFLKSMNALMPSDIAINEVYEAGDDFHARFDATDRTYHYFIGSKKDPFKQDQFYLFYPHLDMEKMNEAAGYLLQHTNFECFSKVHTDVNHFHCEINKAYWQKDENGSMMFTIQANRFLRGMVRAIVGTLMDVGSGKISPQDIKKIILSKNRKEAGRSVPACGLFLAEVGYPDGSFRPVN